MLNKKYNFLTILKEVEPKQNSKGHKIKQVECLCECGSIKVINLNDLKSGKTKSCGCKRALSNTSHGMRNSPEYSSWRNMIKRCYNSNHTAYKNYGGRGIEVCESWRSSFTAFYTDMGNKPEGTTLDRIDVNGHYNKENCRWSTVKEQNINKRNVKSINYCGMSKTIKEWYEYFEMDKKDIKYTTFHSRIIRLGWTLEEAVVGTRRELTAN